MTLKANQRVYKGQGRMCFFLYNNCLEAQRTSVIWSIWPLLVNWKGFWHSIVSLSLRNDSHSNKEAYKNSGFDLDSDPATIRMQLSLGVNTEWMPLQVATVQENNNNRNLPNYPFPFFVSGSASETSPFGKKNINKSRVFEHNTEIHTQFLDS